MLEVSKKFLAQSVDSFSKEDVLELQKLIEYHSDLYYNKQSPIVSDFEYDELFKKLGILEEKFDIQNKQSEKVGALVKESTFEKVKHSRPMISLDNTYNEEELRDFDGRVKKLIKKTQDQDILIQEYTIEFKFDGLGLELIYKNGFLVQGITRGNGIEGEDVTENVMQIANIPKKISYKEHLEVRGEVIMPISVFERINAQAKKEGGKVFSNPRNAASGSVRLLDNSVTKERGLKFFAYDLANFSDFSESEKLKKYFAVIHKLGTLGFEISSFFEVCEGIEEVIEKIENIGSTVQMIDFEIDGLVIKANDIHSWEAIGSTEHHPRYAIAYKFPAEIVTTKILDVEHSVGRTGTITPVAHLEGVNISGAIIRRATLHNYEEVENLGVNIGDTVFIKRAGEVIPKIISVAQKGSDDDDFILPPKSCPNCGTLVMKDDDKVRFYCPNAHGCGAQISERLIFAVGKQGFNIDGFGEKQVELFLREGIIYDLVDVFYIKNKREEILALEGFQEKSVENLIQAIDTAKKVSVSVFITAIGISGVGKKTAKTLSKIFASEHDFLEFSFSLEELENLADIGPEIASNVFDFFTGEKNKELLQRLFEVLDIQFQSQVVSSEKRGELFEKKVCITGSFEGYSRDALVQVLEEQGGEFMSSVSKKTDFLLAGEKAGSKLVKAEQFGVRILTLDEFMVLTLTLTLSRGERE